MDRRRQLADQDYECARFIQLIGEFFNQDRINSLSLSVVNGPKSDGLSDLSKVDTDHGDNGVYLINRTVEPTQVRRFIEQFDPATEQYTLVELALECVAAEREAAEKHEYRESFPEAFANITGDKPIEGL